MEELRDSAMITLIDAMKASMKKVISNYTVMYGWDSNVVQGKCAEFSDRIMEVVKQLSDKSNSEMNQLIYEIETLFKEYYHLLKELGMSREKENFSDDDSLEKLKNWLLARIEGLKEIVTERMELYEDLLAKQREFSQVFKENEIPPVSGIPSTNVISELDYHVQQLAIKKEHFDKTFQEKCILVVEFLNRLELAAIHPIERYCVDKSISLPYNVDTLKQIEEHIDKLSRQEDDMKLEAEHLIETLSVLWSRINEPYQNRERILSECSGHTKKDITKLKADLQRCEEIKQKNLKFYIATVKEELQDWWNKCLLSEEEKKNFSAFQDTHASIHILSLIERELEKIQIFYRKYHEIFELISRREDCWARLNQLEAASKDSARLLSRDGNRGGIFLKEEQERKKVQKELPKVEEALKKWLVNFENEEGREFTISGESVRAMMARDIEEFRTKKDNHTKTPQKAMEPTLVKSGKKRKLADRATPQNTQLLQPPPTGSVNNQSPMVFTPTSSKNITKRKK